ncbi:FAD-binding oxidoreductase [Pseudovibrio exalbescens]|uniref:NAD(P)/FAD-dependent oxidoreductase n=1 Tax=Pseudovibrio exalbescens TaxID=197461 RepID=UPI002366B127|nr:FAD-binding oxidoreductase [Pseudovibrio exalbescens]MDD7911421.1 FAD-binding oxidoreductase [Pseudovibrio exalbescens]
MGLSGSFLYANDEAGTYPASYYHASAEFLEAFPPLADDIRCDVCVVGAGYMGLSTALHLRARGYDVVVLDAHRIGWGASGRNGGQLGSGQRVDVDELEDLVGPERALALWQIGEDAKALVKELIAQHQIDCDLTPGIFYADHKRSYSNHSRALVEKLHRDYHYDEIAFYDEERTRALIDSPSYFSGTMDHGAAHLHPLNLVLGLARAAKAAGVRFHEQTQVRKVEQTTPAIVHCSSGGRVRADHVVYACNGYIENLSKPVARRLMPINNFIVASEPLPQEMVQSLIAKRVAVADSRFVINYYRFSADNRLLFGGGENYRFAFPKDIKAFVRKPMLDVFPQLKDVRLDYGWGGTLGITLNRLPLFMRLAPNVWSAGGFSGHGISIATMAGKVMAEAIDGQLARFDVMAKIPSPVFPGGRHLRYPLMVLGMMYYALRDRL